MRRVLAVVLAAALANGCATAAGPRYQVYPAPRPPAADRAATLLADYVTQLPIGAPVRVTLLDGHRLRGTLMKTSPQGIVVRLRTRIPEPPVELALDRVAAVDVENGNGGSVAKSIAIGIGAGVAGVLGVFAILAAIYGD